MNDRKLYKVEISDVLFSEEDEDFEEYKKLRDSDSDHRDEIEKEWLLKMVRKEEITVTGYYVKGVSAD